MFQHSDLCFESLLCPVISNFLPFLSALCFFIIYSSFIHFYLYIVTSEHVYLTEIYMLKYWGKVGLFSTLYSPYANTWKGTLKEKSVISACQTLWSFSKVIAGC